jgi:predicted outer membrane repeat protein
MKNVILFIAVIGIAVQTFLLTACSSVPPEANDAYYRGLDYARDKNYDKAIEELTLAIQFYPDFYIAYKDRGIVYSLKGDYDKAVADCEAALRISPNYTAAKQLLAEAKQRQAQVAARSGSPSTPAQTTQAQATPAQPAPTPATPVQPVELGPPIEGTVVQGNNFAEKMGWLKAFAQSNTRYIVDVTANENIGGDGELNFSGKSGITINFRGVGANRTLNGGFGVASGVTLVLYNNIIVTGGISVSNGGSFIMNNGTISGNTASGNGGVYVNGGTFTMNNGSTINNGVSVRGGTFTMNGGTISGMCIWGESNTSGTFIINGGTINGSVYVSSGAFTMSNGAVRSVSISGGTFTMSGGTIPGVEVRGGTFTMNNGTISAGNGVYVNRGGTFTMNNGTISGNTSVYENGGGVYVDGGGTFTMSGGTISGNTARENGGGVYVNGTFTMRGGTISGNTARENGGGVYVNETFTKTGGTIYGYSANDTTNSNAVKNASGAVQNFRGHAVYAGRTDTLLKIREGTAGQRDNMSYDGNKNPPTASGAWDN